MSGNDRWADDHGENARAILSASRIRLRTRSGGAQQRGA